MAIRAPDGANKKEAILNVKYEIVLRTPYSKARWGRGPGFLISQVLCIISSYIFKDPTLLIWFWVFSQWWIIFPLGLFLWISCWLISKLSYFPEDHAMWSNSDNIEQVYLLVLDNKKSAKKDLKIPIAEIWSSPLIERGNQVGSKGLPGSWPVLPVRAKQGLLWSGRPHKMFIIFTFKVGTQIQTNVVWCAFGIHLPLKTKREKWEK